MFYKSPTFTLRSYTKDVYPFGSLIPGRSGNSPAYRYGFQGQEKDDELKGEGNSLNYTFRMHDSRVGRFFAVDPLSYEFPWYSPYQFSGNSPIMSIELEGLEQSVDPNQNQTANSDTWTNKDGSTTTELDEMVIDARSNSAKRSNFTSILNRMGASLSGVNRGGNQWEINGKVFTQHNKNTLSVRNSGASNGNPEYKFILPQNFGSWGQEGSDGKIWIGCMSCHGQNGAYNYAAYNSQERLKGLLFADVFNNVAFPSLLINKGAGLSSFETSSLRITQTLETNAEMKTIRALKKAIGTNGFNYNLPMKDQIQVFNHKGVNFIVNGHHRLVVAKRLGEKTVKGIYISEEYLMSRYGVTPEQLEKISEQANKIGNKIRW